MGSFFAIYKITKQPIQITSNTINEKIFSCTQNVLYDEVSTRGHILVSLPLNFTVWQSNETNIFCNCMSKIPKSENEVSLGVHLISVLLTPKRHMDAKILTRPTRSLSTNLNFSKKIDKLLFPFSVG